jgi:hypothetical protein
LDWQEASIDYNTRAGYNAVSRWLQADYDMSTYKHKSALTAYTELCKRYPYNATLLRRRAHVELQICGDVAIPEASYIKAQQLVWFFGH